MPCNMSHSVVSYISAVNWNFEQLQKSKDSQGCCINVIIDISTTNNAFSFHSNPYPVSIFSPENAICFLHLPHIFKYTPKYCNDGSKHYEP